MHNQVPLLAVCVVASLTCFVNLGCGGGGEFDVVPVSGRITCNGNPVTAGVAVRFVPVADESSKSANIGKSASAVVQEDGKFTLSTYEEGDGAVLGRHSIVILPASRQALNPREEGEGEGEGEEDGEEEEEAEEEEEGDEEEDYGDGEDEEGGDEPLDDDLIPLACGAPTELFVEITEGTNVVNIEMSQGGSVTTNP